MASSDPKIATQGQWEDLVARVKAADDIKELTSTDYNYPIGTEDGVALWTLSSGMYHVQSGVKWYVSQFTSHTSSEAFICIMANDSSKDIWTVDTGYGILKLSVVGNNGSAGATRTWVTSSDVANNLTTTNPGKVLDARQGKALDDKIPIITMTTTDPGEGSALAENNYVGVYGGDPIIMDYSTNEVNTGAKWVDGTAIYKKTVNCGALPNSSTKNVAHNVSNLGQIINIEGFTSNGSTTYALPRLMLTAANQVQMQVTGTDIQLDTSIDLSAYTTTYVTLYYTKSS